MIFFGVLLLTDDVGHSDVVGVSSSFSDDISSYDHENSFSNLNNSGYYKLVKFLEDYVASALILILVAPLMLLIAILIKLTSKGSVFFRQSRVGFDGEVFSIYKFRTMFIYNEVNGPTVQASKNDFRVTRIGKIIRRTSLDELPQLFNVLRGEMSLIGPRPHAIDHDKMFIDKISNYKSRVFVKPGITGLAQVKGYRGEILNKKDIKSRVYCDLYYVRNWSMGLDLRIVILTFIKGFINKNAY
jgi:putative colanic acid biosysnthesis UDP-glucose lipid carrier transferase